MKYPIVLANSFAQAACHALRNPIKRANYPYTAAYFKKLYGTTNPQAHYLMSHGRHYIGHNLYSCTREELYRALNILIESEGRKCVHPVSYSEQNMLFPFVIHREEQRDQHRRQAEWIVKDKIRDKRYEAAKQKALAGFLDLPVNRLCDWVIDHETILNEFDIYAALREYYDHNQTTGYRFSEIFPKYLDFPYWRLADSIVSELNHETQIVPFDILTKV